MVTSRATLTIGLMDLLEPNKKNPSIERVCQIVSACCYAIAGIKGYIHCSVFMAAAVKALCSASSDIVSDIHAMVKGTALPPILDKMYSGARWLNGPNTGVTTSKTKMTMATTLPKVGHLRPLSGPSEIQTARREYTAVKALPSVGYSFWKVISDAIIRSRVWSHNLGNCVNRLLAHFVVSFEPEHEGCSWLTSEWLHGENQGEQ